MASANRQETIHSAVRVARLYYFQSMTTGAIAEEMGTSRATVSRLLSYAMENGLVEIRVHDPGEQSGSLEKAIKARYGLRSIQVVPVTEAAGEQENMQRVAAQAAAYVNTLVAPSSVLGLAWGNTVAAIAGNLVPKHVHDVDVVQLNGSGTGLDIVNSFGESLVSRFAQNYGARAHSFPVPAFFDYADTRSALWRERSIKSIRALQDSASIILFSIGVKETGSHVHTGGYLSRQDVQGIQKEGVVGDIATVFFRGDGSWRDVPLNARSSGPDLDRFRRAAHSICVVSGKGKIPGLRAALLGGFVNELVIDEPSARLLMDNDASADPAPNRKQAKASR
jgi:DNA-binding transcriptional regulator LsrR (DeoR family)